MLQGDERNAALYELKKNGEYEVSKYVKKNK